VSDPPVERRPFPRGRGRGRGGAERALSRRELLKASAASAAALVAGAAPWASCAAAARRPNLLFLCSDQQHWQAVGSIDPFFDTPHCDALAKESVVFEAAFCTAPQCSPSRSSMLTGFYPHRTNVLGNAGPQGGYALGMGTLGGLLQAGGYHTAYFGKWHLGDDPRATAGWHESRLDAMDAETTEAGLRFLAEPDRARRPFALFLMYREPHPVYRFRPGRDEAAVRDVPLAASWHAETFAGKPPLLDEFMRREAGRVLFGRPERDWQAFRAFYRERVRRFDDEVGRVLAALRSGGLWEDTVVVSTSDHGEMDTRHRLVFKGPFMYEHVIRIPATIRLPARLGGPGPRRVKDALFVNVDFVPTLLDLAGLAPIDCHGRSARPLLTGEGEARPREYVIGQYHGNRDWFQPIRMIRTRELKWVRYRGHGEELYDLREDPDELVNRAADPAYAARRRELEAELDAWIARHGDPFHSLEPTPLRPARRTSGSDAA